MKRNCILCLALCACGLSRPAWAGPCYDVAVIWGPTCPIFGPADITDVGGLDGQANVIGSYLQCEDSVATEGFLWSSTGGVLTIPRPPGSTQLGGIDINDSGHYAVELHISDNGVGALAYLWAGGRFLSVGAIPGATAMYPFSMNEHNDIVGKVGTSSGPPFAWVGGRLFDLSADLGEPMGWALDINDKKEVTGWMGTDFISDARAFIWRDGTVVDLGWPDSATRSSCNAISNAGIAVGGVNLPTECGPASRAYLWDRGEWESLAILPGYKVSSASDINDNGVIVGRCFDSCDPGLSFPDIAVVWWAGVIYNLNERIKPNPSIQIEHAVAINNAGQIAAEGSADHPIHGYSRVGFLLTPKPAQPADLSDDCAVNGEDLMILLQSWGPVLPSPSPGSGRGAGGEGERRANPAADLDGNGVVNGFDLAILLGAWG